MSDRWHRGSRNTGPRWQPQETWPKPKSSSGQYRGVRGPPCPPCPGPSAARSRAAKEGAPSAAEHPPHLTRPRGTRRGAEPRTHRGAAGSNPQRRRRAPAPAGARCGAQTPSLGAHIQAPAAQLKVLLRSTRRAPPPPASDRCHLPSPAPPRPAPPRRAAAVKAVPSPSHHASAEVPVLVATYRASFRAAGGRAGAREEEERGREGLKEGGRREGGGSRRAARRCAVLFGSLGSSAESVSECLRA